MVGTVQLLVCCIYCCLLKQCTSTRNDYLYFASPGSLSPFLHAGLYGGPVKHQKGGNATGVYRYGFTCAQLGAHATPGLLVRETSYDHETAEVLMTIGQEKSGNSLTLLKGSLCAGDHSCPNQHLSVVFLNVQLQHNIAAFAIRDSEIYFVSEKIFGISATEERKMIELRKLTHCNLGSHNISYPFKTASPFKVERCSTLISVIIQETYKDRSRFHTTSGLAVVPVEGDRLVFFVQLQHRNYGHNLPKGASSAMVLYRVQYGNNSPTKLHEEYVGDDHVSFLIESFGQVVYRSGILCWSSFNRIVCGHVDSEGRLSKMVNVLYKKDVRKVCQAPAGDENRLISTIVTGVAIAKVPQDINRDQIVLYFGCYAQIRGIGGAGLLRKRGRAPAEIYPLTNGNSRIYAGSMFMTKACSGSDGKHVKVARVISGAKLYTASSLVLAWCWVLFIVHHYVTFQ